MPCTPLQPSICTYHGYYFVAFEPSMRGRGNVSSGWRSILSVRWLKSCRCCISKFPPQGRACGQQEQHRQPTTEYLITSSVLKKPCSCWEAKYADVFSPYPKGAFHRTVGIGHRHLLYIRPQLALNALHHAPPTLEQLRFRHEPGVWPTLSTRSRN